MVILIYYCLLIFYKFVITVLRRYNIKFNSFSTIWSVTYRAHKKRTQLRVLKISLNKDNSILPYYHALCVRIVVVKSKICV
jgi:hypothetical protein